MSQRNPTWSKEEIILALDLYFKEGYLDVKHPSVIELSRILRKLSIHINPANLNTFRSVGSVSSKLANISRLDPNYSGKGLEAGNKLEEILWDEYNDDRDTLSNIADSIREIAEHGTIIELNDDIEEDIGATEGDLLLRIHRVRERNSSIVKKKKKTFLEANGRLYCEACNFDFEKQFGGTEGPYIECHHLTPISKIKPGDKTRMKDLILLCPNCHRMLHRTNKPHDIDKFKKRLNFQFNE